MAIYIDGNQIKDPSELREEVRKIETMNVAISGAKQRQRINTKKYARMIWRLLTPEQYQDILDWAEPGDEVHYTNDLSNRGTFTFVGLPTILNEGQYLRGGTLMRDIEVEIDEA